MRVLFTVGAAAMLAVSLASCTAPLDPSPPDVTETSIADDWRPVDSGPREGAMGTTTVDEDGIPITYTVAEGDSADLIRLRFDIWWDSLAREDGTQLAKYPTLYVDEVLTFVESGVAN